MLNKFLEEREKRGKHSRFKDIVREKVFGQSEHAKQEDDATMVASSDGDIEMDQQKSGVVVPNFRRIDTLRSIEEERVYVPPSR